MDLNKNLPSGLLPSTKLKVQCDFCEKSFFEEFLSKHMRISHPGMIRTYKIKSLDRKFHLVKNDCIQCLKCNDIFLNIISAKLHYRHHHRI